MSSPVNTALIPGRSAAAEVSIETILACASGEHANDAHSIAGSAMSSTYRAPARDQRRILLAAHRAADVPGRRGRVRDAHAVTSRDFSAASSTALTML
jgi:hypothetical protein